LPDISYRLPVIGRRWIAGAAAARRGEGRAGTLVVQDTDDFDTERREVDWIQVDGENSGDVVLYALSTCGWCRKTKRLLGELGVRYRYKDVDLLSGAERDQVMQEVERWNPRRSFPTMVINDEEAVVGFDADRIRELLGM
jgi:glutaredoxin-like protein NrdH